MYKIEALETPSICEQSIAFPTDEVKAILLELSLPVGDDSEYLTPAIDVLIGSDHFWDFLTGKVKRLTGTLSAFETVFGWAVQGKVPTTCTRINCTEAIVLQTTVTHQETAPILKAFWELESMGVSDLAETATNVRISRDFSANIKGANGRYEVKLPWKNEVDLADNHAIAEKRFQQLTRRLLNAPKLLQEYDNEMRLLLMEGVAENERDHLRPRRSNMPVSLGSNGLRDQHLLRSSKATQVGDLEIPHSRTSTAGPDDNDLLRIRGRLLAKYDRRRTTPDSSAKTSLNDADRRTGPPTASSRRRRRHARASARGILNSALTR
ncbi:hypothetical protein HPB50_002499 [Hyalomma asiaticum]|uniref:Uncharacterized protein n=1 Tax=Hyalomma asiaticum TaxID=266040 RepID=A0ACB7SJ19_HYAAI|nr:hypothetical protein HPB50_002499 [Hyalomma asiaticum]